MKLLHWFATAMVLFAVPLLASAADGYVTANVNLRAGPDVDYPRIGTIPVGTPVAVQGCTAGWIWCDVVVHGNRGWIAADFIQYRYANQRVFLPAYGARIGIPVVTFVIGNYWGSHYRDRPFYRNRAHWYARPVRNRPPPHPGRRPMMHPTQRPGRDHSPRPGGRPPSTHQGNTSRPTAPGGHAPATRPKASPAYPSKRPDHRQRH